MPILKVEYDDLVDAPESVLTRVGAFVGEDLSAGVSEVDSGLRRSLPVDIDHPLWKLADSVYEAFGEADYDKVLALVEDSSKDLFKDSGRYHCFRRGMLVTIPECEACASGSALSEFRRSAEEDGVNWRREPCAYECAMGPEPHVSIEESIRNNFWRF